MYVYLIRCCEYSKIGVATDLVKRMIGLQCGNPFDLYLQDAYKFDGSARMVEYSLHSIFNGHAKRGEWFMLDGEDFDKFREYCLNNDGIPARDDYYKAVKMPKSDKVIIEDKVTDRADVIKLLETCIKYNAVRKIKDSGVIYDASRIKVNQDWYTSIIKVLDKHTLLSHKRDGTIKVKNNKTLSSLLKRIRDNTIVIRRRMTD